MRQNILEYINTHHPTRIHDLVNVFPIKRAMMHRHIKQLVEQRKIQKIGTSPKVFYVPYQIQQTHPVNTIESFILDQHFLDILPDGTFLYGTDGFVHWCTRRNIDPEIKYQEYEKIFHKMESLKNNGIIDATNKLKQSFEINHLQKLWYLDSYSWEIFGKTKLGNLILYAKQNSDETLMRLIASEIKLKLQKLITGHEFTHVITIPHSVPRKRDFLSYTLNLCNLTPTPQKGFEKLFVDHVVAQKTLKSKEDRIRNAQQTLFWSSSAVPQKVLLIDDACGSGSTLNIAAKKILSKFPNAHIFGVAFVGSMNGFEVIRET